MTLKELYNEGKDRLNQAGINDYQIDSFYLLEWATGISKSAYFVKESQEVTKDEKEKYLGLIDQRARRIPLQHLTGVQEFMGLPFQVTPDVLIPRQDTEILVEIALDIIKNETTVDNKASNKNDAKLDNTSSSSEMIYKVLDMCTGSGCILISILAHAKKFATNIAGTGADICPFALIIAEKNSKINMVDTVLIESDLFDGINDKFQMIVANPPYIKSGLIGQLDKEVRDYDPIKALDGGEDGLRFYEKIIDKSRQHLECGGYLLFEIGHDQGLDVSKKMEEYGYKGVKVIKDLANSDRVVLGRVSVVPDI